MADMTSYQPILEWTARLPFLDSEELALLLGEPRTEVEPALHEFRQRGWIDVIRPSTPELSTDPRYVLSQPARDWLSAWLGNRFAAQLPLGRTELIGRVPRIETTIALNRLVVRIVTATRKAPGVELADVWALPMKRPRHANWSPGVHGFGQLRVAGGIVSFLIVIDGPDAPAAHRGALVSGWYRHQAIPRTSPPIVIVCDGARRMQEWRRIITDMAERSGVACLNAVVVDGRSGTLSRNRLSQERDTESSLIAQLARHAKPSPGFPSPQGSFADAPEAFERAVPLTVAIQHAGPLDGEKTKQDIQLGALVLATAPVQWRLLECLGRLPLLTDSELAVVLRVTPRAARRLVARCDAQGVIEAVERPAKVTSRPPRYVLTQQGLRLLAARAGVPLRRFAKHTPFVAALPGAAGGRLQTLIRQFDHTVGANSFMLNCLRNSTAATLTIWRNPIEAAVHFECGGVRRTLRPDGAGEVLHAAERHEFLLEWDRGTERIAALIQKLDRYAAYFGPGSSASASVCLLVVTSSPQREGVVWRAVEAAFRNRSRVEGRILTITASQVERFGPFAAVWRSGGGRPGRVSWLAAGGQVPR